MASTLEPNSAPLASGEPQGTDQGRLVEYERYIAAQIRKTRGQVKGVEITGAVLRLLVGALVYLLAVALIDHWLLAEGLGMWGRLGALACFVLGIGVYVAVFIAPLIARRVNPVYAAHTIEQHQPTLKNSLVNFLLLRGSKRELAPAVYQAIEQRAANDLSHVPVETVVDRTRLVRWSYALLVMVAIFALYVVLSPKDPLRSLARMIAPWADLRPPTRVTIEEVEPGHVQAFHGDTLTVSALVRGVSDDEPVTLVYSTNDGQTVDRPIAMTVAPGDYRHEAQLPDGAHGLQQGVFYYLVAGDFATEHYRVEVLTAPAILVTAVDYEYPSYAAIANGRVERVGDIKALVGTKVTVHGRANRAIKEAHLDFDCDGTRDLRMKVVQQTTSVTFDLTLNAEGKAEHGSYQLLFVGVEGRENPQPIRHTIEVAPDRAPTVELVLPEKADLEVPLNGVVGVAVRAEDPDFALRDVTLHARRGTDVLLRETLHDASSRPHEGEFRGGYIVDLAKLAPEKPGQRALAAGDTIEYWAEARDIKQPTAGRAESVHYQLRVTSRTDEKQREEQLAEAKSDKEEFEKPAGEESGAGPDKAEYQVASRDERPSEDAKEQQDAKAGEQPSRVDPEKDPAAAMKEVLKHEEQKKASPPAGDEQDKADPQGDAGQPNEGDSGEGQSGEKEQQASSGEQGEKQSGDKPQDGKQQQKPSESGEGKQPGQSPGEEASDASGSKESSESSDAGSKPSGAGLSGARKPGDSASDDAADGGEATDSNSAKGSEDASGKPSGAGENAKPTDKPGDGEADERVRGEKDGDGEGRQETRPEDSSAAASKPNEKKDGQSGEQGAGGTDAPGEKTEAASSDPKAAKSKEDSPQLETEKNQPGERSGQGAQSGQSGDADKQKTPPSEAEVNEKAKGGEPEDPKGNSGAGQAQGDEAGSPSPQEKNTPKEKQQQSPDSKNKESSEPSSPSTSPKESDSQGGEQGDRSGGGQEGGGQKANQKGTGGAGQNTAADEGGSAAEGSGGGETSDKAGNKQPGGEGKGKPQEAQGGGSGEQAGQGAAGEKAGGSAAGGQPGKGGPGAGPGAGSGSKGEGGQGGGGQNESESEPANSANSPEPGGDDADLEAARKATDLVLDRFEDQLAKNKLDQDLLDRLGWTREDVERFVKRWNELKDKAGDTSSPGGAKQLDDALRRLGLSSGGTVLDGNEKPTAERQLRESFRSNPPADYAEQYRAYTEGLSRGRPSAKP